MNGKITSHRATAPAATTTTTEQTFFRTREEGGGGVKNRPGVRGGKKDRKRRRGQQEISRGGQGIYRVAFLSIRYPVLEVYSFKEHSIPLRTTLQSSKSCSDSCFLL
jgi:hypothetical protein